jgi:hypothetical protein
MPKQRSMSDLLARQRKFATAEAIEEVDAIATDGLTYHRKVVREWEHRPGFRQQKYRNPNVYTIKIVPTGRYAPIWYFVDRGTKPHEIAAKNVPMLKFQTGYNARTAAPAKFAQGTGKASGAWVTKAVVQHPGTEAREFTQTWIDDLEPPFPDRIQAAIQRGLNKANR